MGPDYTLLLNWNAENQKEPQPVINFRTEETHVGIRGNRDIWKGILFALKHPPPSNILRNPSHLYREITKKAEIKLKWWNIHNETQDKSQC